MIKTIFVPLSGSDTDTGVLATALAVARPLAAHLRFFHLRLSPGEAAAYAPHADFSVGSGITNALELLRQEGDVLAAKAFANCHEFCEANQVRIQETPGPGESVSASWMEETENVIQRQMFHARHSDLSVLGRPRNRDFMPRRLIEILLVGSGRPVVIAPDSAPQSVTGIIAVGWKETAEAARAVTAALPLLARARRVILLGVTEDGKSSRPALDALAHQMAWHGISADTHVISDEEGPPRTQLLETAVRMNADLLVVGGFGHSQLREELFGGVTRSLIDEATLPVFMQH